MTVMTGAANDTIFALSSGGPPTAIAVLRISGPDISSVIIPGLGLGSLEPRRASLRTIRDRLTGEPLDQAITLFFPAQGSVTGEPLLELHCHGGRAVIRAVENALSQFPNVRRAEPGEFTRRAFDNGVMNLAEIEGLGDLLAAETELQRRSAHAMMRGGFSSAIAEWENAALAIAASIEAQIDFADEGDVVAQNDTLGVSSALTSLVASIDAVLARPPAQRLKDGVRVVIAGPPNSGKSSLFNNLVEREAAIVTPLAGTTRDLLEAPVAFNGIPLLVIDSAGLRETTPDMIEAVGIEKAKDVAQKADILLWLGDSDSAVEGAAHIIQIASKSDLGHLQREDKRLAISTVTGEGLNDLRQAIHALARGLLPSAGQFLLSDRQMTVLARSRAAFAAAMESQDDILKAENIRIGLSAFGELTGRHATEAMLDAMFSRFCVGK